jgi:hypothetical protein
MPRGSAQRALYRDLRKIVDLRDRTGWVVDRIDVQEVAPSAMRSACQVGEPARLSLASWLDRRIAARVCAMWDSSPSLLRIPDPSQQHTGC